MAPMLPVLSVVIPLYDEARRLPLGLQGLAWLRRRVAGELEAILVDDGSSDETLALARRAEGPGIRVLAEPHRGKGGALRAGVLAAVGDRILLTDVDWSVPPPQAMRLLDHDADVVVATREGPGARRLGEPPWRHLLGRAFNRYVQAVLLAGYQDTQCGCKLLRGDAARALFSRLTIEGWAFDVELLMLCHHLGLRVAEQPVAWRYEADTRLRPVVDALAMAGDVWRIRRRLRRGGYGPPLEHPHAGRPDTPV
ncbi:MAG: glycosyltransferase [Deltaproteobacteria bacterium]|nr:MAG: glycosyltransferase [Deltaproteobacteria bacterium]